MFVSEEMAALGPYRIEPKCVRDAADYDSSEDNGRNERLERTF